MTGLRGAPGINSTIAGPPGADSTVAIPPGADSTIAGPPGADSTLPSPPGADSTVAGPPRIDYAIQTITSGANSYTATDITDLVLEKADGVDSGSVLTMNGLQGTPGQDSTTHGPRGPQGNSVLIIVQAPNSIGQIVFYTKPGAIAFSSGGSFVDDVLTITSPCPNFVTDNGTVAPGNLTTITFNDMTTTVTNNTLILTSERGLSGFNGNNGLSGQDGAPGAAGATGADSTVPGPPGADSTVPGPSGADSTAPGPPGADSTVPPPSRADSTVPGHPGEDSTVSGPASQDGSDASQTTGSVINVTANVISYTK